MNSRYNPQEIEKKIYSFWEKGDFFNSDKLSAENKKTKPFSIIMPPCNANAPLHIGHAVFATIEDILIRFNRMQKKPTLWLPGFDHAGFETQVVYEKKLEKEGKTRFQFKREELYKNIWDFTQKNKETARGQLKSLGVSADWSREKFTLDKDIVKTVLETFEKLYKDGLIYRGKRIINWCPKHQTSLSDLEVKHKEVKSKLWRIKYKVKNQKQKAKNDFIVVATTRPETMLGDTAVAVNPKDKRYKNLIGKKVILPLAGREIPIIADSAVDTKFGTGAVKITPAHDPVDFEIGKRHKLPLIEVIDKKGKMIISKQLTNNNSQLKKLEGLYVLKARKEIVRELEEQNFLQKEEPYSHNAGICYKCETLIEPLISKQWFIKIKPLAKRAAEAVESGEIKFHPRRYKKIFLNWMKDIYDWNISRQIVWGIRIPVWYCEEKQNEKCKARNGVIVSKEKPEKCPYCGSKKLVQETDVFDTWFSSGQWPFAALGFPENKDYKTFYPTSVMETGWDILFFWVARMIMLSLYRTGKVPFYDVVLHGLVRDNDRQKMSKSKGNVIDPLAVVEDFGADALRMALIFGTSTGSDIIISEEKVRGQRNFTNKVWNASRFVLMNIGEDFNPEKTKPNLTKEDKWILKELERAEKKITKEIKNYQFHEAADEIYHFFWHKFCDKTIEDCKERINEAKTEINKETPKLVLWQVLYRSLKLLHPFMPFLTEEIYQNLPSKPKEALIVESWPR